MLSERQEITLDMESIKYLHKIIDKISNGEKFEFAPKPFHKVKVHS